MRIMVLYVALGLASMVIAIGMHIVKAEFRGYKACEWWDTYIPATLETFSTNEAIALCLGLIVAWPMRLVDLNRQLPELYDLYELKWSRKRKATR